jgi:hypothetical protein
MYTRFLYYLCVEFVVVVAVAVYTWIFWDITLCSLVTADVSEEYIPCIFRVEEYAKHESSVKVGSFAIGDFHQTTRLCVTEDRTLRSSCLPVFPGEI